MAGIHLLGLLAQDPVNTITWVERAGIIALLLIILVGGIRKWWVFGWLYENLRVERDQYRDLALRGARAAEQSANVASRLSTDGADLTKRIAELQEALNTVQQVQEAQNDG